ncbi:MAG: glycosyltransferase family 2 protein [Planctomycetales bacterium]|nr:glycosyltransferase family 2 protein [Planctomycetales bacterium]
MRSPSPSFQCAESAPQVRVVLPTYNRQAIVSEAVHSVMQQTYEDWELRIIDDGSSDDTPETLRRLAAADARIHVTRQPNGGAAAARNVGLSLPGEHKFVAFIDADDLWRPWHLEEAMAVFSRHPQADAIFARSETIDHVGKLDSKARAVRRKRMDAPRKLRIAWPTPTVVDEIFLDKRRLLTALLNEDICPHTPTVVLRRASLAGHRFPTHLIVLEDLQFWCELATAGLQVAYLDRTHATVRYFGDNLTMQRTLEDPTMVQTQESVFRFTLDKLRYCRTAEQRQLVRGLIASRSYLLGQCYGTHRLRWRAARTYFQGFRLSGNSLPLRGLLGAAFPDFIKRQVWRLLSLFA